MTGRSLEELSHVDLAADNLLECEERLIARLGSVEQRVVLAGRGDIRLGTIRVLRYNGEDRALREGKVRCALAANPNLDEETFESLSRRPNDDTAPGLVRNPRLTVETQRKIAAETTFGFRGDTFKVLAQRSDLDPQAMTSLIEYISVFGMQRHNLPDPIAAALVANPSIDWKSRKAQDHLLCRNDAAVQEAKDGGADMEAFAGLAPGWNGTLQDLIEATRLV